MIRILIALLALLLLLPAAGAAEPPDVLRRGINITNWFRFPPSDDPAALRAYLDDAAMEALHRAGYTFVRLPVQAEVLASPGVASVLVDAMARLQHHRLAVIVGPHPGNWHLETDPGDRARLLTFWHTLAPMLRRLNPAMTFPEVLNEPVFTDAPAAWATLQHQILIEIRASLPMNTVVLTGANWGSIAGLLALAPEPDLNVAYSFHLYDPAELTALGAYRAGLDSAAMARLPFPVEDSIACQATASITNDPPTADLMRFYCTQHWDAAKLAAKIMQSARNGRTRNHAFVLAGEILARRND